MTGNKITEWSYDLPTEPGFYLACEGDIEVVANTTAAELVDKDGELVFFDDYESAAEYHKQASVKWARLLIGSDAK